MMTFVDRSDPAAGRWPRNGGQEARAGAPGCPRDRPGATLQSMADPPPSNRLGGMALANGLLVQARVTGPPRCATRTGAWSSPLGRKRLLRAGRLTELPMARGLVRLGEAFAVLPAVRRGLPQALRARGPPGRAGGPRRGERRRAGAAAAALGARAGGRRGPSPASPPPS